MEFIATYFYLYIENLFYSIVLSICFTTISLHIENDTNFFLYKSEKREQTYKNIFRPARNVRESPLVYY